jgi:hypothetical protein
MPRLPSKDFGGQDNDDMQSTMTKPQATFGGRRASTQIVFGRNTEEVLFDQSNNSANSANPTNLVDMDEWAMLQDDPIIRPSAARGSTRSPQRPTPPLSSSAGSQFDNENQGSGSSEGYGSSGSSATYFGTSSPAPEAPAKNSKDRRLSMSDSDGSEGMVGMETIRGFNIVDGDSPPPMVPVHVTSYTSSSSAAGAADFYPTPPHTAPPRLSGGNECYSDGSNEQWSHTAQPPSDMARCAFLGRKLHPRMPLDPTHVRLKRTCV